MTDDPTKSTRGDPSRDRSEQAASVPAVDVARAGRATRNVQRNAARGASRDAAVLDSWHKNASPWIDAVRRGVIASRKQVTDAAIVDAVMSRSPRTVLDVGCGEGWLARDLAGRGVRVVGIDAVPHLVEAARNAGGGAFYAMSYDDLAAGALDAALDDLDVVVCNFSLIGEASTVAAFRAARLLLSGGGAFVVQTLHPVVASESQPYADGWREGSWAGFSDAFSQPAPWFFRTIGGWLRLFEEHGFAVREIREPVLPVTQRPASMIFMAEAGSSD